MPLPKRLTAYQIEKQVLEKALELREPLIYQLPTPGKAIAFRQRLYAYRKMAVEAGLRQFDTFAFRLNGKQVIIEPVPAPGLLTTLDGDPIPLNPIEINEEVVPAEDLEKFWNSIKDGVTDADT